LDQSEVRADEEKVVFQQWFRDEADAIEQRREKLWEEKREIDRERRELEREKRKFLSEKRMEDDRIQREKQLFEMKWKILEDELKRFAKERVQFENQRRFYQFVDEHETRAAVRKERVVSAAMFFVGVEDGKTLKKRYKELIKIYHPDNLAGDVGTIQEINREYDRLQEQYRSAVYG